jgi:hypothetical protein
MIMFFEKNWLNRFTLKAKTFYSPATWASLFVNLAISLSVVSGLTYKLTVFWGKFKVLPLG